MWNSVQATQDDVEQRTSNTRGCERVYKQHKMVWNSVQATQDDVKQCRTQGVMDDVRDIP